MSFEYDNKGKFFTDVISKIPLAVLVQTTTHLIQGMLHIRRDERLKDELDRDIPFLALTDIKIIGEEGQELYKSDFVAVQRKQIIWVLPQEEEKIAQEADS